MKKLNIKLKYKTYHDDILNDFYIPVLSQTRLYYRAVGYFSSSILLDYIKGLLGLIKNNGEIRLIISPFITENDFNELQKTYLDSSNQEILDALFESFLNGDEQTIAASKLFVMLVNSGVLKVLIAEPMNLKGLFHEKIGIFIDNEDNQIAIIGSNNETGNAVKFNQESFNTFCSWKEGQQEYIKEHLDDFNSYWAGENVNIKLCTLESAISDNILRKFDTDESMEDLISIIIEEEKTPFGPRFTPYDYQLEAVDKWFIKKQGIFKFATGAGKTKTAIYLMDKLKVEFHKKYFIIVVPDKTLVNQWYEELIETNDQVLKCFSDYPWQSELKDIIDVFELYDKRHQYIVVTNDTFFEKKFQKELQKIRNNYLLVVDECHTWGTTRILSQLPKIDMKLGLSATPELFFSEEKTRLLLDYFGGITHEYTLEQAIKEGYLVGYKYYPIFVQLTDNERDQYDIITQKIVKMIGRDIDDLTDKYDKALEMLLFKRARIVYAAHNKIIGLGDIIEDLSKKGRLLIYCGPTSYSVDFENDVDNDSMTQLQEVNKLLGSRGMRFAQYTSKENDFERSVAINLFKKDTYSTLVAIKCLDEGINIPQIERAVILASSTNPREFIQRRGRILRTFPGKKFSEIYDFIVYEEAYESLMKKELERLYEFARIAINSKEILDKFEYLFKEYLFERGNNK